MTSGTGANFGIRFDEDEKASLRRLASRLQRSMAGTIKVLVREALAAIEEQDARGLEIRSAKPRRADQNREV